MLALKQLRVSKANGVVRHFRKLGTRVVLKVAATSAIINNLAIAKDAPTLAVSNVEYIPKVIRKISK